MTIFATNEENDEMREIIENALDTDEVRGCCYELLALNIVIDKVQPIILLLKTWTWYIKL